MPQVLSNLHPNPSTPPNDDFSFLGSSATEFTGAQFLATKIEIVPLATLVPYQNNPRKHDDRQTDKIAGSIKSAGMLVPLIVDAANVIIAGHGRYQAAKKLGLERVPVIRAAHLTPALVRSYRIADNRLAELSGWDDRALAVELKELTLIDLGGTEIIDLTGFEIGEIDARLEVLGDKPAADKDDPDDVVPESNAGPVVSRIGDVWMLGRHRLACGSSLEDATYVSLLAGHKVRAVWSDPPYNLAVNGHISGLGKTRHREFVQASGEMSEAEFTDFLARYLACTKAHSVPGSLHYACMDAAHTFELLTAARRAGSRFKTTCTWAKTSASMGSFYRSQTEFVHVFKNGGNEHRHINNIQPRQVRTFALDALVLSGRQFLRPAPDGRIVQPSDRQAMGNGCGRDQGLHPARRFRVGRVLRLRHHDHRGRKDRTCRVWHRTRSHICGRRYTALAESSWQGCNPCRDRPDLQSVAGRTRGRPVMSTPVPACTPAPVRMRKRPARSAETPANAELPASSSPTAQTGASSDRSLASDLLASAPATVRMRQRPVRPVVLPDKLESQPSLSTTPTSAPSDCAATDERFATASVDAADASRSRRDDYEVGYKKPPRQHQFKPGNNANPRGRPKGARNLQALISEAFFESFVEKVPVNKGGKAKLMTKLKIGATRHANNFVETGDVRSILPLARLNASSGKPGGVVDPTSASTPEADAAALSDLLEQLRSADPVALDELLNFDDQMLKQRRLK